MKCAVHPEVDATGFCRNCGKALCAQCVRDVRGILYCEACLANMLSATPQTRGPNPALAAILGFVPGLGAVYNSEYMKALVHVMVFAGLIAILSSGRGAPFFGIMLAAFIFYMVIDAYRVAKARLYGQAPSPPTRFETEKPIGPLILIGLGVIFLLSNILPIWDWVGESWPVVLILIGVLLLWKRSKGA